MAMGPYVLLAVITAACASTLHPSFRQDKQCPIILQPDRPLARTISPREQNAALQEIRRNSANTVHSRSPRIVNGDFVQSDSLREVMVALLPFAGGSCTGSLISSTWVLSAAHCKLSSSTTAILGTTQISADAVNSPGVEIIDVDRVYNHPEYSDRLPSQEANDIALIRLERPASTRRFMRLNMDPSQPEENSISRVAGYGDTFFMDPAQDEDATSLRQVDVPIFPISECMQRYRGQIFPERHICAGYSDRSCDSCQGDSGGPIFQYDEDDNPVQVGIVSFGSGCGTPDVPGVYVRTDAFREFMESVGAEFTPGPNIRVVVDGDMGGGTSAGAIAGGIIATIAIIAIIVVGTLWYRRRRTVQDDDEPQQLDGSVATTGGVAMPPTTYPGQGHPPTQPDGTAGGQPFNPPPPPPSSAISAPPVQQAYPTTTIPSAQTFTSEATKLFPPPAVQQPVPSSSQPPPSPAVVQGQTQPPVPQPYPLVQQQQRDTPSQFAQAPVQQPQAQVQQPQAPSQPVQPQAPPPMQPIPGSQTNGNPTSQTPNAA